VSQNQSTKFEAEKGVGWHPREKSTFGNVQQLGLSAARHARYDADDHCWTMDYQSVGLDGTTSHGRYTVHVVDSNTMDWSMTEWRFPFHIGKKVEMTGKYTRKK
jgi:hypothetical protein